MTDAFVLLRPLGAIESTMADIYDRLERRHSDDPDAAGLFHRLARDERDHAAQVDYARRMTLKSQGAFTEVGLDVALLDQLRSDLDTLRRAMDSLPLGSAIAMLLSVEQSSAEAYARPAVAGAAGPLTPMLAALQHGDERHARALAEFARSRGFVGSASPGPDDTAGGPGPT